MMQSTIHTLLKTAGVTAICGICMILASCGHRPTATRQGRTVDPAISAQLRRLHGSWICHEYMISLAKTHSPIQSSAYVDGIFSFVIDSAATGHDTLYFTGFVRGHREDNMWIALGKPDSLGFYSIGIDRYSEREANQSDNAVKIRIDSPYITLYTRTSDSLRYQAYGDASGHPADYILRQYTARTLFKGAYSTPDTGIIFGASRIIFDPDRTGRISGSPLYDSFDINIDVLEQKDSVNYMELFDTRGVSESHSYTYRIRDNTIKVYPLTTDAAPCRLTRVIDSLAP